MYAKLQFKSDIYNLLSRTSHSDTSRQKRFTAPMNTIMPVLVSRIM